MTQAEITALLNTLPDEWIESAVSPQKREPVSLLRTVPAVAACLIVLVAAVLYPKLRRQTPGRTVQTTAATERMQTTASVQGTEPSSDAQQITGTQPTALTGTAADDLPLTGTTASTEQTQTTASGSGSGQQTVPTGTGSSSVSVIFTENTVTGPDVTEETHAASSRTDSTRPEDTGQLCDTTVNQDATSAYSAPAETCLIPVFRSSGDVWEAAVPANTVTVDFSMPQESDGLYVPPDFEFSQYDCLLVHIQTNCTDAAVTACRLEEDGLVLTVSCLDAPSYQDKDGILFLLQLPKSLHIRVTDCRAEYQHLTDRAEYLSRLTDTLVLNLPK